MPDLADLYPGFASHWIDTSAGKIFARAGGSGPPLMLLHGYAQSNVMWHKVADELAKHFALVIPDLPGYGWSAVPDAGPDHAPYTKRSMAVAMIDVMEALGHARFNLAGHDRGGRVSYRLALDHPGRPIRLATLDIVPTYAMWHDLDARLAYRIWHWTFLALPAPGPENIIGGDPVAFWDWKTAPGAPPISLMTRQTVKREPRSPARCWRCGAQAAFRARRRALSTRGAIGQVRCVASRLTAGIICPKKIHRRRQRRSSISSAVARHPVARHPVAAASDPAA